MSLQLRNISIGYGKDKAVFEHITCTAEPKSLIVLIGVNGIGKSTLLRTISGLQPAISGSILIDTKPLQTLSASERAKYLSLVLTERLVLDSMAVEEFIALGRAPYTNWLGQLSKVDKNEINDIIQLLKIEKLQYKQFNKISDGEKQKVLIARALCQQANILILDEPTAFLDYRNKKEIIALLAQIAANLNKVIILSTHDIEAALEQATACWIMAEDGKFKVINKSTDFKQQVLATLNT